MDFLLDTLTPHSRRGQWKSSGGDIVCLAKRGISRLTSSWTEVDTVKNVNYAVFQPTNCATASRLIANCAAKIFYVEDRWIELRSTP